MNYGFGSMNADDTRYGFVTGATNGPDTSAYTSYNNFKHIKAENWANVFSGVIVRASVGCGKLVNGTDVAVYAQNQTTRYENDTTSENKVLINGICMFVDNYYNQAANKNNGYDNYSTVDNPSSFTQNYNTNLWTIKYVPQVGYENKTPEWNATPVKS